jgi:hypothetical protein
MVKTAQPPNSAPASAPGHDRIAAETADGAHQKHWKGNNLGSPTSAALIWRKKAALFQVRLTLKPRSDCTCITTRKNEMSTYVIVQIRSMREHVSEVDLMSAIYFQSVHRRLGRQWTERINSLSGQIAETIARALQGAFGNDGSLVPIPVRTAVVRRRDQSRSHD